MNLEKKRKSIFFLLVEDDRSQVKVVRRYIKQTAVAELKMDVAARLSSAFEKIEKKQYDAILLDLGLPDCRGIDTLKKLQQKKPGAPVVVLTGLNDRALGIEAIKYGAQDYLWKEEIDQFLLERSLRYAIERYSILTEKEKLIKELRDTLSEVKTLSGLLPICASCKNIRNDKGYWVRVEKYINQHTDVQFTHSLCEPCADKLYPELGLVRSERKEKKEKK
ncbi:MAG: response regulator [bacterium]|nr:response regulator [bacterium]